ncbi:hypothetical protein PFISCL1PPCAC_15947 [Pristionchus fissidentatus]|uniref:Dehydrogenase n=1 Tax=Pristionchus fissidentatus TaxID=1538716 RepID=A0AAV5VYL5_9BILA|nr:hypothetical protein PFISCL1PPCAC_15947 [Pristionchus fissidentatus]
MLPISRNVRIVTAVAVAGSLTVFLLRRYRRFINGGQFTEDVSAEGKIVVVTGANTGIGFETAKELNLRGAKVYMLCRHPLRAQTAREKMIKAGCDASRLIYIHCDLSSFKSVRECAVELIKRESHIDILINNAGIMIEIFKKTEDGHEIMWQTNYLGHFLLTELLLPIVENSKKGRIINVASINERLVSYRDFDLRYIDAPESSLISEVDIYYSRSKLANIMHARELSRRLRHRGINNVTVNSLHPGQFHTLNNFISLS